MILACIEVGSNDAANLVNAVFGARVLSRKRAVFIAGIFVVLGATFASPVMDTIRREIFDIHMMSDVYLVSIFLSSYLVNTLLLYAYSAYGIPVSTTATLVFSIAGGAYGVTGTLESIQWQKLQSIITAIFISIFFSSFASFLIQKFFRKFISHGSQDPKKIAVHGPWISSLIIMGLLWYMLIKGMNLINPDDFASWCREIGLGEFGFMLVLWLALSAFIGFSLFILGEKACKYLFHVTCLLGVACMSFAFGQNDLANCASPGVASLLVYLKGVESGSSFQIPMWGLFACGFLIFLGMRTKRAQRVTRAEVNTASQHSKVKLYAPRWCLVLGKFISQNMASPSKKQSKKLKSLTSKRNDRGKKIHYDTLRASVILSVSASVIAFASSLGLPISTTYVSFASVISTGWADKVFAKGSSELKVGRSIWVISCWFIAAILAALITALVAMIISKWMTWGISLILLINYVLRRFFKNASDEHEKLYHQKKKKIKQLKEEEFEDDQGEDIYDD